MAKHWKKRRALPLTRYKIARKMTERWYRDCCNSACGWLEVSGDG